MPAGCGAVQGIPTSLSSEAGAQETGGLARKNWGAQNTFAIYCFAGAESRTGLKHIRNGHVDILDFKTSY